MFAPSRSAVLVHDVRVIRLGRSEVFGNSARRPQARQHNVYTSVRKQCSGKDRRFWFGVRHEKRAHHVPKADPGYPLPRARGVLPRQPGPRSGYVGPGVHHAGNCHRRQVVRRGRRGTVGQNDCTHAARARVFGTGFPDKLSRN